MAEDKTGITGKLKDAGFDPCELCYDVTIIGGGVAGLSAALYAARDGFKTLVLEGEPVSNVDLPGGALMLTESIENFPGFPAGEGMELVNTIRTQVEGFDAEIESVRADKVELTREYGKLHMVHTSNGVYKSKSVIIATGALARRLGVPGEDHFYGRGVSTCATCDGFFFRDKTVVVVGGGDTAVEDALFLTRYAAKVYVMHYKEEFKSVGPQFRELLEHPKVEIIRPASISAVLGEEQVTGVEYHQHGEVKQLAVDGVFVAIGRNPATGFLREHTDSAHMLDAEGYVQVQGDSTQVVGGFPGVYAAGDAVDRVYRQAIIAAGKAVQAEMEARHYLLSPTEIP